MSNNSNPNPFKDISASGITIKSRIHMREMIKYCHEKGIDLKNLHFPIGYNNEGLKDYIKTYNEKNQ